MLNQQYQNWEAIVVDDGSTDNSHEVVAQFKDPRIKYKYQPNQGLAAARNTGIRVAKGTYLAFLDADDKWHPSFIEKSVQKLLHYPDAVANLTGHFFVDANDNILPRIVWPRELTHTEFREQLIMGGFFPPCTVLARAQDVRVAGMFDTELAGMGVEDWDLWLRLADRGGFTVIRSPLAYYRVTSTNMSSKPDLMHASRMDVVKKHFGQLDVSPRDSPVEKRRAYGYALRAGAFDYIAANEDDSGWDLLECASRVWPALLLSLDTFYELACGDQPRGYRGKADLLDIDTNGAEMLQRLNALFAETGTSVQALRRDAYGNAYLALAMLSDQAGDWSSARCYMFQAARHNPRLVSRDFLRRLAKLAGGKRASGLLKNLHGSGTAHAVSTEMDLSGETE